MASRRLLCCFLAATCLSLTGRALAAELGGREILEEVRRRHEAKTEVELQEIILRDAAGNEEKRQMRSYTKELEPNIYATLLAFLSPANIRGTALLVVQHRHQEDDQWLYMPALGRLQRIAKGGQRNYFMGTDFAFEDLRSDDLDAHAYYRLSDESYQGRLCYVVEAVPISAAAKRDSGYSKRVVWVRQDNFVVVKVEFFDTRGKPLKVLHGSDFEQLKGGMWRANRGVMENLQRNHKTLVRVLERQVNVAIKDETFTERFILEGRHINKD
jgi:hypothetical protein